MKSKREPTMIYIWSCHRCGARSPDYPTAVEAEAWIAGHRSSCGGDAGGGPKRFLTPRGRPTFRIWDNEACGWHERTFTHELQLTPGGDLMLWDKSGMTHESVFPDRYLVVPGAPT